MTTAIYVPDTALRLRLRSVGTSEEYPVTADAHEGVAQLDARDGGRLALCIYAGSGDTWPVLHHGHAVTRAEAMSDADAALAVAQAAAVAMDFEDAPEPEPGEADPNAHLRPCRSCGAMADLTTTSGCLMCRDANPGAPVPVGGPTLFDAPRLPMST